MLTFSRLVLLCLFSVSSFAYELEKVAGCGLGNEEECIEISVSAEYEGRSSIKVTGTCYAEGDSLKDPNWLGWEIGIKPSPPIDARATEHGYYKVLLGGYDACRQESYEDPFCERFGNPDLRFDERVFEFLNHDPMIEIQRVKLGPRSRSKDTFDVYAAVAGGGDCPEGWQPHRAHVCRKPEPIYRFDFSWFEDAHHDMKNQCRAFQVEHQDKISSHIKRILNW